MDELTVQDLRDYRAICAELRSKEDELRKGKVHVVDTVQTAANFPYWKHVIAVEGDIYLRDPAKLKKQIIRLRDRKAKIEKLVMRINPATVRRIVQIYFVEPAYGEKITWDYVADKLNDGSTGDACRMKMNRYFAMKCRKK